MHAVADRTANAQTHPLSSKRRMRPPVPMFATPWLNAPARLVFRGTCQGTGRYHAPAGIALMAGEAGGLLDAWASSPPSVYFANLQPQLRCPSSSP